MSGKLLNIGLGKWYTQIVTLTRHTRVCRTADWFGELNYDVPSIPVYTSSTSNPLKGDPSLLKMVRDTFNGIPYLKRMVSMIGITR
eukprot:1181485-Prorocentrum_minimum.AAC.2